MEYSASHSPSSGALSSSLTEQEHAAVNEAINALKSKAGALLPVLHHIQGTLKYVPPSAVPVIAKGLNLSDADVHGVISFYHEFRHSPPGANVIQICRAESCQSMGSRSLEQHACSRLGIDYHQTTTDNNFTLEPVYCLGNCMNSPSVRVNDQIYGEMTDEEFDLLLNGLLTQVIEVQLP
ncbi:formate dehydrogenase subunit gamma [Enterovibrio makurazakiensis]|uniref:NADH-quinone oxidoreductase subunit E n=1 Tax=Enterovibrio gelatinilyticus TaxID=2899819 RepID=A0ABT5R0E3_9GAMM|nr:formate dehydrogenase subunit gamma [Enterovibrio sp. ZSDZ42]MDD1793745.1 formate dehydrogenase subunit gamma [Enterovibrio sp. ZSDZ42]